MASLSYLCVCTLMLRMCRPCLARLHERLQDRLRPEPCQIGSTPLAPAPEPRKIRSLEHFSVGGATKSWLHLAPSDSTASNASPAPDGHAADGRRRGAARGEEDGWWELVAAREFLRRRQHEARRGESARAQGRKLRGARRGAEERQGGASSGCAGGEWWLLLRRPSGRRCGRLTDRRHERPTRPSGNWSRDGHGPPS